jgi:hypothetical protein
MVRTRPIDVMARSVAWLLRAAHITSASGAVGRSRASGRVRRMVLAVALALALVSHLVVAVAPVLAQDTCDIMRRPDLRFYCADRERGLGYVLVNEPQRPMIDVYEHLGGERVLGPIRSQTFRSAALGDFTLVATDRFLIALRNGDRPDPNQDGSIANTLDIADNPAHPEWNEILLRKYGIPRPIDWNAREGETTGEVARRHMEAVFLNDYHDPELGHASELLYSYLVASGDYTLLGLPMSLLERVTVNGEQKICVRLQRSALCTTSPSWRVEQVAVGADVLKAVGFIAPDQAGAFDPAPPPGRPAIQATDIRLTLAEPLPWPASLVCGLGASGVPLLGRCAPSSFRPEVTIYEQGARTESGRSPLVDPSGLELTATLRVAATNAPVYERVPLVIEPSGRAFLPVIDDAQATADLLAQLRLEGRYREQRIDPTDATVRITPTVEHYQRIFGWPALYVVLGAALAVVLASLTLWTASGRWIAGRRALLLPAYLVYVGGTPVSLSLRRKDEVWWARWLLGHPAIRLAGLRFSMGRDGVPVVAGKGTLKGAPLGWRGQVIAEGAPITGPSGQTVSCGAPARPAPASGSTEPRTTVGRTPPTDDLDLRPTGGRRGSDTDLPRAPRDERASGPVTSGVTRSATNRLAGRPNRKGGDIGAI